MISWIIFHITLKYQLYTLSYLGVKYGFYFHFSFLYSFIEPTCLLHAMDYFEFFGGNKYNCYRDSVLWELLQGKIRYIKSPKTSRDMIRTIKTENAEGPWSLPGKNREGNREKMVVELVWEARNSMSKCLEMGKSEGGWKLASNSICQEPREHARWLRFFPGPCGAAALTVHPHSSTLSSAP